MDSFVRVAVALSRASGILAAALIVASVLVVCQMVLVRYVLGQPTVWQTEFVIYALVATTFLGSPYVLLQRGHVNMDIVVLYAAPRLRWWMAILAYGISLVFCCLFFVYGSMFWYEAWSSDWHSDTVWRVPLWIPYLSLPVGMGLLTLQLAAELAQLVAGRAHPFGLAPEASLEEAMIAHAAEAAAIPHAEPHLAAKGREHLEPQEVRS